MLLLGAASVVLLVCVACLLSIVQWRKRSGKGKMPEGPAPLPIVGNILQVKPKNLAKTLEELSEKYGPVFSVQLGSTPVVVLSGYEVVKEALIDRADEFAARGHMPIGDRANKGLGIVFSNNEGWLQVRRFALTTLRNFGMGKRSIEERIQEEAEHLLEEFTKTNGMPFDPTFKLSCAFSNVICSIVFGRRYDYKDKKFLSLMNNMNNIFEMMNSLWGQEKDNPKSHFHMTNLITSTFDLFIAGTETSSTTTRYGLLLLLKYPKIQEKVQEEIDRVVGRSRRPCVADRTQMPYTDAVVHEIQRFITLIPTSVPRAVTKDVRFRGYVIPKGTTVIPLLSTALYDSKEFPNPTEFNPGHFLNEKGTFRKSEFFIPFSAGKRICPGEGLARMEIFLLLTTILQNFTLKPVVSPEELSITPTLSGTGNVPPYYQLCAIPR
ncbi:cytochrome P450 2C19-like isoform X2 [Excalfactoria chinensis]|uniref:cytochrome P450 2C19-like isoform X2 n=1 Tax=Excalfactoria chinensis TaxID=46218 RepID=UPI003B3A5930